MSKLIYITNTSLDVYIEDETRSFDFLNPDQVFNPVIVGGGKPAFRAGFRRKLELIETRRFDTGVIHVHYRVPALI